MTNEIEYKNYGPHRYARVDNADDAFEILVNEYEKEKENDPDENPDGIVGMCYTANNGKHYRLSELGDCDPKTYRQPIEVTKHNGEKIFSETGKIILD